MVACGVRKDKTEGADPVRNEQVSMYDVVTPVPQLWECRETCRRFGESVDYPSWWHGEARCLLANGDTMRQLEFNNRCFIWCSLYEQK